MSEFLEDGVELFACMCVRDYGTARTWYEALLGAPPAFKATDTEAVWELAPHRWLVVEQRPDHAGHGVQTIYVDDLDERVAAARQRGVEPGAQEVYPEGVRKVIYHDPDGNELGFGGNPVSDPAAAG